MANDQFEWNWAEKQEIARAEAEAMQRILDSNPALALHLAAAKTPFTACDLSGPKVLEAPTPPEMPGIPSDLNAYACALLNPDAAAALAWQKWMTSKLVAAQSGLLVGAAVIQLQKKLGPLNCIPLILLEEAFGAISLIDRAHAVQLATQSLITLFQPFDFRPNEAEDRPYAPYCALLIKFGANCGARSSYTGASALSGINNMLAGASLGMARSQQIQDFLVCAELLLANGATPDLVREMPPLETIVPNRELLSMLHAASNKTEIMLALAPSPESSEHLTPKRL